MKNKLIFFGNRYRKCLLYVESIPLTMSIIEKGDRMMRKIFFCLVLMISFVLFGTPAWAQYDIAGWWSGKGTYEQGDFVTGDWTTLQARGKKASFMYITFEGSSNTGTAAFVIWDDLNQDYILEPYYLFVRNNIIVLFIPTFYDSSTGFPAGATIILRPLGSASTTIALRGFYTLYDLDTEGSTDLFVRMGSIMLNRVLVKQVPDQVKELVRIPFPQ